MEQVRRTIAKTFSWRIVATFVTATIVWVLTGEMKFAATVGLLDTTIKLLAYFIHERLWLRVRFGLEKRRPDYEI